MKKAKEGRIKDDAKANYKPFKCPQLFTIEKLKMEYQKEGIVYSDEKLVSIRNAFDFFHEICYHAWINRKNKEETSIKEIQHLTLITNEESNIIHPSEYRRAS